MSLHLALVIAYAVAIATLGLWTARYVRTSGDFFVAARGLGPGLVFSSMLAANIGAGATVGAAGLGYNQGLSAWWWSGSAGIGSLALAFWVGPRLWRLAHAHGFYTIGDFLEFRYGPSVRGVTATLIALISLVILAAQLIAGAAIVSVITGAPRWMGALAGGAVMTIYFTAGGLLGTAWVNTLQLAVMLAGFVTALPFVLGAAGGLEALTSTGPPWMTDIWYASGPGSGWTLLALTGPAFVISPGLIQKAYGAASERALTVGVAMNAAALMLFAFAPVLLGMSARAALPGITDPNLVLPMLFLKLLPAWLGALAMAAVFSTAVDTCDGILFMLSTSMSQDIYRRHINPRATDRELLRVARTIAVIGGTAGVILSIYLSTVIGALRVFYSVLGVSLFVPVLGGLISRRAGAIEALASIAAGVGTLAIIGLGGQPHPWVDPTSSGIVASAVAYVVVLGVRQIFRLKADATL
ncbi:MAG TPA: sodium:solute symporter family protein [Vicinamibacterales bacterium]